MARHHELSGEAWAIMADLFVEKRNRDRPRLSDRLMLDGALWVLCSGAARRDMPDQFGPWSRVYQRFQTWRNQGTFDQMLKRLHLKLNDQSLINLQVWMIDSTAVNATRASSGAGEKGA
jgi:transposase